MLTRADGAEPSGCFARATVLLVDDDEGCLRAAARLFERSGFGTCAARTLAEARGLLAGARPSCVVTEYRLPDGLAIELLTDVRTRDPHVGRVVLTGAADPSVYEDAVNRGAVHAVFSKPWDGAGLCQGVRGVLARCALEREREDLMRKLGDQNRQLAETVAERSRQLERAKCELEAIFDAWRFPVALVAPGCTVVRANTAWAAQSGEDVRKAPGRRCHVLLFGRKTPCAGCPVPARADAAELLVDAGDEHWTVAVEPLKNGRADGSFLCRYQRTPA